MSPRFTTLAFCATLSVAGAPASAVDFKAAVGGVVGKKTTDSTVGTVGGG
jgi:hypothetical protein